MVKSRCWAVGLLSALPAGALAVACSTSTSTTEASVQPEVAGPGASAGQQPAPPGETPEGSQRPAGDDGATRPDVEASVGRPDGLVADADLVAPEPVDGLVAGTDSSTPVAAAGPAAPLRERLIDFGRTYIGFDYRLDEGERLAALESLVAPALLEELAQPIPGALQERLVADERVVEARFVDLVPLGDDLFQLRFDVSTATASAANAEETRLLVISIDSQELVSDVR